METTIEMTYTDVAAKMSYIIKRDKTKITKNDPALIFNWDLLALQEFAERANRFVTGVAGAPVLPPWLTTMPPIITQTSLTRDIFTYLAQLAGGRFHAVVLAPNTQKQFAHLIGRLRDVETHSFMQAGMAEVPDGQMLAVTGMVVDGRRALNPRPLNLGSPAGYHVRSQNTLLCVELGMLKQVINNKLYEHRMDPEAKWKFGTTHVFGAHMTDCPHQLCRRKRFLMK